MNCRTVFVSALFVGGLLAAPRPLQAQAPTAVGSEFQVNSYTPYYQGRPVVAALGAGNFVVVWSSDGSAGTDTSRTSVQGRRFSSNGVAIGPDLQVNTYTPYFQERASVAAVGTAGAFVVVWFSSDYTGSSPGYRIEGRRFASDGNPVGPDFQVNSYTMRSPYGPRVVPSGPSGSFVVVWQNSLSQVPGFYKGTIQLRRFGSDGTPIGLDFQVNSYTYGGGFAPQVSLVGTSGDFIVVWESSPTGGTDTSQTGIQARRFASDATPIGFDFQVNSTTFRAQYNAVVAPMGPSGAFVVVWESQSSGGNDTAGTSIQGRLVSSGGIPIGSDFQVNSYTTSYQRNAAVAAVGNSGDFIVTWQSGYSDEGTSIQERRFAFDGTPIGADFQVDSTPGIENRPSMAALGKGLPTVVVWETYRAVSSFDILGQRLTFPAAVLAGSSSATCGQTIAATASFGPGNAADWVGLFPAGASNSGYVDWFYLNGLKTTPASGLNGATVSFIAPTTAGTYEFRLFPNNNSTIVLATSAPIIVAATSNPLLSVTPSSLDYGNVGVGGFDDRTVSITNIGTGTLAGTASTSLPFSVLSGGTYSLTTGQSQTVTVRYWPTSFTTSNGTLTLTGGGGGAVSLSGTGSTPPTVMANLGITAPGGAVTATVANGPGNPRDWVALARTSDPLTTYVSGAWKYLNNSQTAPTLGLTGAVLTFNLPATPAIESYEFRLFANDTFKLLAQSWVVSVRPLPPTLSVAPTSLPFGSVPVGSALDKTVTVSNTGGGTLSGLASTSAPYSVVSGGSYSLVAGATQTVTVRFSPTNAGLANGLLNLTGGAGAFVPLSGVGATAQDPTPLGSEFQVNTNTSYWQAYPAVAALGTQGSFVVVWMSGANLTIQGRRFASNGNAIGSDFQVNSNDRRGQYYPVTTALGPSGSFVVVWEGGGRPAGYAIAGRRYASDGSAVDAGFQVDALASGAESFPAVASLGTSGSFVVAWETSATGLGYSYSVRAARFASDGSPIGLDFQVNTYSPSGARHPAIASVGTSGSFVVVWRSQGSAGTDTSSYSIQGQRFASDGTAIGAQFQVNTYTSGYQAQASVVAIGTSGSFVVVWQSQGSAGTDTDSTSIQGRRFAFDGSPIGADFQVNSYTTLWQFSPKVAAVGNSGDFVVSWASEGSASTDTSGSSIQARRFAEDGAPIGADFQVNTSTTTFEYAPSVAGLGNSPTAVFVWSSPWSVPGVFGQRMAFPAAVHASVSTAVYGQTLTATAAFGPGNPGDWVALARTTDPNTTFTNWGYLNSLKTTPAVGLSGGVLAFGAPFVTGDYEFRFFSNNGFTLLAKSEVIRVAPLPATATPNVTAQTSGSPVQITVANGPGSPTDWLALAKTTDGNTVYTDWKYLNGSQTAPAAGLMGAVVTFTMPAVASPTTYEVRLFSSNGFTRLATSAAITVSAPTGPVLTVTPASLDYGMRGIGSTTDLTVVVSNTGIGTLNGVASTSTPFSVVPGGAYSLTGGASRIVTVEFAPTSPVVSDGTLTLTGGGGGIVSLSGTGANIPVISIDRPGPFSGETVGATVTNVSGNTKDWMALAKPTDPLTVYVPGQWKYLDDAQFPGPFSPGTVVHFVMPAVTSPTTYELRLFSNNGYTLLAKSTPITVY